MPFFIPEPFRGKCALKLKVFYENVFWKLWKHRHILINAHLKCNKKSASPSGRLQITGLLSLSLIIDWAERWSPQEWEYTDILIEETQYVSQFLLRQPTYTSSFALQFIEKKKICACNIKVVKHNWYYRCSATLLRSHCNLRLKHRIVSYLTVFR